MNGGDAVISVLGARGPVMAEATRAIVEAAKQKGPKSSPDDTAVRQIGITCFAL
jgi:hypothetical protein